MLEGKKMRPSEMMMDYSDEKPVIPMGMEHKAHQYERDDYEYDISEGVVVQVPIYEQQDQVIDSRPVQIPHNTMFDYVGLALNHGSRAIHKKDTFLVFLAMVSGRTENPFTLALIEEPGGQSHLITGNARQLVGDNLLVEFADLTFRKLTSEKMDFNRRTILLNQSAIPKKVKDTLRVMMEHGVITDQLIIKGEQQTSNIVGKPGLVLITDNENDPILDFPSLLKLRVLPTPDTVAKGIDAIVGDAGSVVEGPDPELVKNLASMTESLSHRTVNIPYLRQVANGLDPNDQESLKILRLMVCLLSVITILRNIISTPTDTGTNTAFMHDGELVATKVEWFYLLKLVDKSQWQNTGIINQLHRRVFEAVKKINLKFIDTYLNLKKATEIEINMALLEFANKGVKGMHYSGWAPRKDVCKAIWDDGGERFGNTLVNSALESLFKLGHLEKNKHDKAYVYAVAKAFTSGPMQLPEPSEIIDPVYNGKAVIAVDPITGDEVTF
jgi:hypothetical protein